MISKAQKNKLKRVLKRSFIPDIQDILSKKNILNKKGLQYSVPYISQVLNGVESNKNIEDAIFELYHTKKTELAKMQDERNQKL